jgi:hypothetical protein
MSATPPAPAPAARPRPAAAWLAFSAAMTAEVAPVAGRADLTVTVAPAALVPRNSRPSGDTYGLRITGPADPGHCLAGAAAAWSSAR